MPREYRHISEYETEIIRMHSQGMTLREISEKLGFTHKQVQEFKTIYNKKQRMIEGPPYSFNFIILIKSASEQGQKPSTNILPSLVTPITASKTDLIFVTAGHDATLVCS